MAGAQWLPKSPPDRYCSDVDESGYYAYQEHETKRLNRNFIEILQEIRVAQTGVQILFAFLLTLAFSPRFTDITGFAKTVYVATLMFTLGATGLLTAPVVYHRLTSGRKMRPQLVTAANRFALWGITLLLLALSGSILLVTEVTLGLLAAIILTAVAVAWLGVWWYVIPLRHRQERTKTASRS
jgi:predicted membrane channel-forming protein YqfA (hemolysin III family)